MEARNSLVAAAVVVIALIAGLIGYGIGHRIVEVPEPPKPETNEVTKWKTHYEPTTIIKREDCDCPGPTEPEKTDGETTLPDTGGEND